MNSLVRETTDAITYLSHCFIIVDILHSFSYVVWSLVSLHIYIMYLYNEKTLFTSRPHKRTFDPNKTGLTRVLNARIIFHYSKLNRTVRR